MRLRHTAALGLSAGALVLSGGLAMADSSGGTGATGTPADAPGDTLIATESAPATATTRAFPGESGRSASTGGFGYGFVTAGPGGESSFSVEGSGDGDPGDGPGDGRVRRMAVNGHELSDEQRECMERNGAAPPAFAGERPTREEMEAHRQKVEAAMDECGIEHPEPGKPGEAGPGPGGPVMIVQGKELSDEQRECLEENAPPPPAFTDERPSREDMDSHRKAMEAAMDECGVDHPDGA